MLNRFRLNRITALVLAVCCTITGISFMAVMDTKAEDDTVLLAGNYSSPSAGMSTTLSSYIESSDDLSVDYLSTTAVADSETADEYINENGGSEGKYIVCIADEYSSVYTVADGEYIECAKIYKNGVATLISIDGEWSRIVTGDIEGYVKTAEFAFGEDAKALAESTYATTALINVDGLYMYEEQDTSSVVMCILPSGYEFTVTESDTGTGYTKISVSGIGEGYVETVGILTSYGHIYGITLEEESVNAAAISEGAAQATAVEVERAAARAAAAAAAAEAARQAQLQATRQALVNYACSFVGWLPYVWGGASLTTGADCSGFTSAIFAQYGYSLSRSSAIQSTQGRSVSISEIKIGDIVVYSGHVAIYIGNGQVVHSPRPGRTVSINSLYMMTVLDVRRIIE